MPQFRFEYVAPRVNHAEVRRELVEELLAKSPVAICLYVGRDPRDSAMPPASSNAALEAYVAVSRQIVERGVLLVTMGGALDATPVAAHVGVNRRQAAQLLGERLPELLAERRSYLLWHERDRDGDCAAVYDRFVVASRAQPNLALLDECDGASEPGTVKEQIEALTDRFRNAGLLVTLDPEPWLAPKPRCALPSGMRIATIGSAPPLWSLLKDGEAAALAGPLTGDVGYKALELAWARLSDFDAPRQATIPSELVTPATLDDFIRRYAAAAGMDAADFER